MVMFHHEISYSTAQQRGLTQAAILNDLTEGDVEALSEVDFDRAANEIEARLTPV
jgi:hypothetical protein